ncbi:MAG: hypothetical protein E7480_08125 [Ruminococcaceae bacterium]|nr:hypothetical protein [Oscillospiraceae bacterium]
MKKFLTLTIALLMLLLLVACGNETTQDKADGGNQSQAQMNNGEDSSSQGDTVDSPYQVTKEQWETAFEYGEDGEKLLERLSNHTCNRVTDNGIESIYKQVPEENLYYENNISYEREYYYFRKDDKVDVYACDSNTGCIMFPDDDWEGQKLNATDNLKYDISYFALAYDYDNVTFSEEEKAYIYNQSNAEIKIYFENGKLVRLYLIDSRGGSSDYTQIGTTKISLPTEYEVRN